MAFSSFRGRAPLTFGLALLAAGLMVPGPAAAQEPVRPPAVTVVSVTEAEVIDRVPISGTLVPRDEVLVYPEVNGYTIEQMYFDIGDTVQKGDVLARLNTRTLEAQQAQAEAELTRAVASVNQADSQISSAQATLTQATTVLDRARQLLTSGSGTQASLDQAIASEQTARAALNSTNDGLGVALAQKQQAEAQLEIARINLAHATIRAPVEGLIATRNGRLGAIAASGGDPIFRLIEGGRIEVEAEVVETAMSGIHRGADVLLDIAGVGPVKGEVRLISPVVDPVTRLGTVRVGTPDNPDLRSGLFASGWIITAQRVSPTVPATAVLTDAGGTYVLVVADDRLEHRQIAAGLVWQDRREVLTGLSLGEVVVAKAGAFFSDGDVISPIDADLATVVGAGQ